MQYRKLGKSTDHRKAMLKNQVSSLLWNGKIETTVEKAKEVRRLAEKLITLAVNTYEDTVKVTKQVRKVELVKDKEAAGGFRKVVTKVEQEVVNDGPKKLCARRKIMANTFDLQEIKRVKENRTAYKERTKDIRHPLVEKIFNEYAPKYAQRKEDKGNGGGYTRIIRLGARRGDSAEVAIIEMI